MHNHPSNIPKPQRRFEVDMSSAAIASLIREVGELYELGVSLAKAKPCPNPNQTLDKFIAEDSNGNPLANNEKFHLADSLEFAGTCPSGYQSR